MKETEGSALTERQRYWLEQIRACEASGKTIAEYATAHGVKVHAMYAGKKKLVEKGVLPQTCQTASKIDQVSACNFDQAMRPDCGV